MTCFLFVVFFVFFKSETPRLSPSSVVSREEKMPEGCLPAPGGQDEAPLGIKSGHSHVGHPTPHCPVSAHAREQGQSQQSITLWVPVCVCTSRFSTWKAARSERSLVLRVYKWHTVNCCLFWLSLPVAFRYIAECSACVFFLSKLPHVHPGFSLHLPYTARTTLIFQT